MLSLPIFELRRFREVVTLLFATALSCSALAADPSAVPAPTEPEAIDATAPTEPRSKDKMKNHKAKKGLYRHVVMFGFKADAKSEEIAAIEKAFAELPSKIDTIIDFEWGTNVSPENLDDGLTHCFLVTFKDQAGLDVYLPHEAHKAFVAELKPILEKVVVIDFVSK